MYGFLSAGVNRYDFEARAGSATQQFNLFYNDLAMDRLRFAGAFAQDDAAASFNGESVLTDDSATLPACNALHIGRDHGAANQLNGHIRRLQVFPARLPNTTIQALTR